MKKTILSLILIFISQSTWAGIWYWPQISDARRVMVTNPTGAAQPIWMQVKRSDFFHEFPYFVNAHSSLVINESDFLTAGDEYSIKTQTQSLILLREVDDKTWIKANQQVSPEIIYSIRTPQQSVKLSLQNLNYVSQKIIIRYLSSQKEFLGQSRMMSADYYKTATQVLNPPRETAYIELIGEGRLQSRLWVHDHWIEPELSTPVKINIPNNKIYFLLSDSNQSDSFVVALDDEAMITKAREIISKKLELMLFGRIRVDQKSWNRPLLGHDKTPWSWTVAEVTNFAEIGSISCDGSPSIVEEQLPLWLSQERICFWRFRVIRELKQDEVQRGALQK